MVGNIWLRRRRIYIAQRIAAIVAIAAFLFLVAWEMKH